MSQRYLSEVRDDLLRNSQSYTQPQSISAQQPASPSAHPNSEFDRLRAARRFSRETENPRQHEYEGLTSSAGPPPPPHRASQRQRVGQPAGYTDATYSNVTPGVDNFGEQAAGGIAGIAMGVADTHARESGLEALRNTPGYGPSERRGEYAAPPPPGQIPRPAAYGPNEGTSYPGGFPPQSSRQAGYNQNEMRGNTYTDATPAGQSSRQTGYNPNEMGGNAYTDAPPPLGQSPRQTGYNPHQMYDSANVPPRIPRQAGYEQYPRPRPDASQTSLQLLGGASPLPGARTPQSRSTGSRSLHSFNSEAYPENVFGRYSRNIDPALAADFDPNSIEDDGDDGLEYRNHQRISMLSTGNSSRRSIPATAGPVAAGGLMGALGGLAGRGASGTTAYDPVQNVAAAQTNRPALGAGEEKSEWLTDQSTRNKRLRLIVVIVVAVLVIGGIVGGVVGGLLSHKKSSSSSSSSSSNSPSAASDTATNGDLNSKSPEIQALMNNKNLHKVFPGIDYTPLNTQFPLCLTEPPSQNNVTRDLAVLSQLTNTVRLYGTDCNQTEMLLHSIDQLGLNGTVKVWLGVWQDTNGTTNARQLQQMYEIFEKYGPSSFVGVIIGNEVLFREDMTATELGTLISDVRTNLTAKGINLPIATSDLGDDWTAELAEEVDYLMANIHPFFAGVAADVAAAWTYNFWTTHDTILKTDISKNIISETGWPSTGGTDCGGAPSCTQGSVAGITEMNSFMDGWVCDALNNGTNYFWFEAFDEPWKIIYDTPGKNWEDKWGLMDINRNLKPGVVIPDCGGKTVS